MSGPGAPSAAAGIWPRGVASTSTGPIPNISNPTTSLPVVNNANLPPYNYNTYPTSPPPIPQLPTTPFPSLQPQLGATNTSFPSNYTTPNPLPLNNAVAAIAAANANQSAQNEAYQRRLTQLEDENALRRNTTVNMQQMGVQILQGQMDVQEQVLEYQFMLEQCMNTLDSQNQILTEQAEELALLRSKMRHLDYLMDAFKASKEGNMMSHTMSRYGNTDSNSLCCGEPLSLPPPSTSPFFAGGPTRVTASTFQPFNPRYRSPTSRAKTAAILNQRNTSTPTDISRPTAANRPARRFGPANN